MFEQEPDSDDDFECYFLKPVNEYNITDKIKEANKELFDTPKPGTPLMVDRKVQFRRILEDYEDGGDNLSIVSVESDDRNNNTELKNGKLNKILEIENPTVVVTTHKEIIKFKENTSEMIDSNSDNEEICEEIVIGVEDLQMKNDNGKESIDNHVTSTDDINRNDANSDNEDEQDEEEDDGDDNGNDDDDEDDLSVIVASYIENPDNRIDGINDKLLQKSKANMNNKKNNMLRKKKKNIKAKSANSDYINFNYKICCEYRNAIDYGAREKLPKYTGYLSEYGLTKEQFEAREKKLEKRKKFELERNLKATEDEIQKMADNERAFTRWLKNKMRFPVNKTKNMFDFKPKKSKKDK